MSRTVLLAIVLTLAVGPNAQPLCKIWCEPQAPETACHYDGSSSDATVTATDICDRVALSTGAVLLDEVRRGTSDTTATDIEFDPQYRLSDSTTDARPGSSPGRARSLDDPRLSTVLRI